MAKAPSEPKPRPEELATGPRAWLKPAARVFDDDSDEAVKRFEQTVLALKVAARVPFLIDQHRTTRCERIAQEIPLGRFGKVEEVAAACELLCSERGGFISGQVLHVNGGHYMY